MLTERKNTSKDNPYPKINQTHEEIKIQNPKLSMPKKTSEIENSSVVYKMYIKIKKKNSKEKKKRYWL